MTQVTTTIPATAADAASPAAAWLKTPCPGWCAYPEDHLSQNLDDDRRHRSACLGKIGLSLEPPISRIMQAGERPARQQLSASMVQHYKAPEPDVVIDVTGEDCEFDLYLTLAEAEEFARGMLELVRAAKSA